MFIAPLVIPDQLVISMINYLFSNVKLDFLADLLNNAHMLLATTMFMCLFNSSSNLCFLQLIKYV